MEQAIYILFNTFKLICLGCALIWPFYKKASDFADAFSLTSIITLVLSHALGELLGFLFALLVVIVFIVLPLVLLIVFLIIKAIKPGARIFKKGRA